MLNALVIMWCVNVDGQHFSTNWTLHTVTWLSHTARYKDSKATTMRRLTSLACLDEKQFWFVLQQWTVSAVKHRHYVINQQLFTIDAVNRSLTAMCQQNQNERIGSSVSVWRALSVQYRLHILQNNNTNTNIKELTDSTSFHWILTVYQDK